VVLGLLTAIAPFLAILWLGVPSWFPAGVTLDTVTLLRPRAPWNDSVSSIEGRLWWSLLLVTGVTALLNLRGWHGRWLPLSLLLAGLAIPQACIWMTGQSKYCLIGGIVPFSDPAGYLDYACQMLQNHRIAQGFTDRPMFAAMLSSLLQFTGPNLHLQPVLGTLVALCGVGMFLAVREMHARFGNVAAVCFLFVIYVFYNRSIGMLMTEHLGLALGLYAFALLLRGLMERQRGVWFAGIFLLTAALCARAGAFFVLPALCWVTGRHFKNAGRFSLPMFSMAIAVMLVPFALNRLLLVRLFDRATRPQSNFSYVAYGVLRGTNWQDAYESYGADHAKIRAATLEIIRKKPHKLLQGIRRTWREFFWESYGFIFMGPEWSRILLYAFLLSLALGVARATRSAYDGFTVAVAGGIFVSIPCVPPADCDVMRAYAATMPLHACLAATGISALVRFLAPAFRRSHSAPVQLIETRTTPGAGPRIAMAFGSLTLFLVFVIPLGRAVLSSEKPAYSEVSARPPSQFPRGLLINLVSDEWPRTCLPNVRISDFRARLGGMGSFFENEAAWLAGLSPGVSLVTGGQHGILVLSTDKLVRAGSHVDFVYFKAGWLILSRDRDLSLPNSEDAPAVPVPEKVESK